MPCCWIGVTIRLLHILPAWLPVGKRTGPPGRCVSVTLVGDSFARCSRYIGGIVERKNPLLSALVVPIGPFDPDPCRGCPRQSRIYVGGVSVFDITVVVSSSCSSFVVVLPGIRSGVCASGWLVVLLYFEAQSQKRKFSGSQIELLDDAE